MDLFDISSVLMDTDDHMTSSLQKHNLLLHRSMDISSHRTCDEFETSSGRL